jgi:ketosteroid isomerase-like protein
VSNVQFVKSVYDDFGKGDIPAVLAAMAPDIEWREAEGNPYQPSGNPWIGADAIMQNLFMKLGADWDRFTVTPRAFHDAGDTVVVEVRYGGSNKKTGKALDAQACHVLKVKDGKLAGFQQYVDTAQWQDVAGAR